MTFPLEDWSKLGNFAITLTCMRLQDNEGMNQRVQLGVDDPRRISVHLAPIPPPPTRDIVASQKSRSEDQDKTNDFIVA
jgi:hypothetical protein